MRRILIKTSVELIVFVIIMVAIFSSFNSINEAIIVNDLALGQMSNSNEAYVLWVAYNDLLGTVKAIMKWASIIAFLSFGIELTSNAVEIIKIKKENVEDETD